MKRLLCGIALAMQASVVLATEYSDPIELTGGEIRTISVASGTTDTYTGAITGEGSLKKTGVGTLVLANAANSFDGGVDVNGGTLKATASGAFGTGKVVCSAGIRNSIRRAQWCLRE